MVFIHIITHLHAFTMRTSIIMSTHTYFIYFFSPSLLVNSCFGNIQWSDFNWSSFLLHILGLLLLLLHASMVVHSTSHPHPLNWFLSFTLKSLRSSPFKARSLARSRVNGRLFRSFRGRNCFCLHFVFLFRFSCVKWSSTKSPQKKELAAGLDPSDFRANIPKRIFQSEYSEANINPQDHGVLALSVL